MENNLVENDEGLYKSNCRKDEEEKKKWEICMYIMIIKQTNFKLNRYLANKYNW